MKVVISKEVKGLRPILKKDDPKELENFLKSTSIKEIEAKVTVSYKKSGAQKKYDTSASLFHAALSFKAADCASLLYPSSLSLETYQILFALSSSSVKFKSLKLRLVLDCPPSLETPLLHFLAKKGKYYLLELLHLMKKVSSDPETFFRILGPKKPTLAAKLEPLYPPLPLKVRILFP